MSLGISEVFTIKKYFLFMILAIAALACGASRAQQPAQSTSSANEPNVGPCVAVYGAVRAPALIVLRRPVRLAEMIAMAGGLTDRASDTVQVIHTRAKCFQPGITDRVVKSGNPAGKLDTYVLSEVSRSEEKSNPNLDAGDVVIVNVQAPIYVVGSVMGPREIYSKDPLTLSQAIKLAGGALRNAQVSKVMVHRQKTDPADFSIHFDLGAIRKHWAPDPVLQAYDIVFVPSGDSRTVGPPMRYPTFFDPRPLIPRSYRVIH
ncbi:MAG TPA: SLBB domain-containing protein [Pyrinomonadaceae bacterium]|nr:SLBB domain-containing protein [Pyrinomonadaceae bacterium]